jgi:hypothetical protein
MISITVFALNYKVVGVYETQEAFSIANKLPD